MPIEFHLYQVILLLMIWILMILEEMREVIILVAI